MIFGIIILALVAGVAFYHYVQGFFSAMISAVLALLAALVALSYHETLAESFLAPHMPNAAHAVALTFLFAAVYLVLRLCIDRVVPGNIRVNVLVEKIGAGICGLFAAIFSVGTLTLAAQMLPFDTSIGGYTRFEVENREVRSATVPGKFQKQDLVIYDELKAERLDPDKASDLFPLPVDNIVLSLASHLSDGGALSGANSFSDIHPSYLDELFGQRLGTGTDSRRVLYGEGIQVKEVYSSTPLFQRPEDFELKAVRSPERTALFTPPDSDTYPLVVRLGFDAKQAGKNQYINLSPAAVRLVLVKHDSSGGAAIKQYNPIGAIVNGKLVRMRVDDPLFIESGKPVDFAFLISPDNLATSDAGVKTLPKGSFVEAKRSARVSLSDKQIATAVPTDTGSGLLEKKRD